MLKDCESIGANSVAQKAEVKLCRLFGGTEEIMLFHTQSVTKRRGIDTNHKKQMATEL